MTDMTDYFALPGVSASRLKLMRESPLHYATGYQGKPTAARAALHAQHCAILEPDVYAARYGVLTMRRGTKAHDAWLEEHPGVTDITQADHDRAQAIAAAVRAHPVAGGLLALGRPEVALEWEDRRTGLACKGRLDWLTPDTIVDCKGYGTTNPRQIARRVVQMGAHIQAAHYCDGVETVLGVTPRYYVISYEQQPPWDVCVVEFTDALAAGKMERDRLMDRVVECMASGRWPGRHEEIVDLVLPPWAWGEDEDMIEVEVV